jgi:hypothetical protein
MPAPCMIGIIHVKPALPHEEKRDRSGAQQPEAQRDHKVRSLVPQECVPGPQ